MSGEIHPIIPGQVPLLPAIPSKKATIPLIGSAVKSLKDSTVQTPAPHASIQAKKTNFSSGALEQAPAIEGGKRSRMGKVSEKAHAKILQAQDKATALIEGSLGAIQDFRTKARATAILLMGLRSHSAHALAIKILSQTYRPTMGDVEKRGQSGDVPNLSKLQKKASEMLEKFKAKRLPLTAIFLMKLRAESLSKTALNLFSKIFRPARKFSEGSAREALAAREPLALKGRVQAHEMAEEGQVNRVRPSLISVSYDAVSTEPLTIRDIMDFGRVEAEIKKLVNSSGIPEYSEKPAQSSSAVVDAPESLVRAVALGGELIRDELVAKLVLEDANFAAYHGNLDEEYAADLLSRLPANSALLFSERDGNNSLSFVVATRNVQGQLNLYDYSDLASGFDWMVEDLKNSVGGFQLVGYDQAGKLMANRWVRTVPREPESVAAGAAKQFLSNSARAAVIKNNAAIAQSSSYYQGIIDSDQAEEFLKQMRAPVGTALLRYDDSLGNYFISYVGVDARNAAVIRHERALDVGNSMQEHAELAFVGNGRKAESFLGKRAAYYCGQMEHASAEKYLKGVAPESYAMIYAKILPDGRMHYFAGVNKAATDEQGNAAVKFTSYDIGTRPDFEGSWVKFYAENPSFNFIAPQAVAMAEKLASELTFSAYNHHHIGIPQAEKLLQAATVGTIVLHTIGEGENEANVFSVKLSETTTIHRTLPAGPALPGAITELLDQLYNQPEMPALPGSFNELLLQLHEKRLVFAPPTLQKLNMVSQGPRSPFKTEPPAS